MAIAGMIGFLSPNLAGAQIYYATGMFSTFLLGAAQTMTVWYFIRNSRLVLHVANDCGLPENARAEATGLRRLVVPRGYLVLLLTAGTLIAGGGTPLADLPAWPHVSLAVVTMLAGLYTSFIEYIAFRFNAALNDRVATMIKSVSPTVTVRDGATGL